MSDQARARRLFAGLIALAALLAAQSVIAGFAPSAQRGGDGALASLRRLVWGPARPAAVRAGDDPAALVAWCTAPRFARTYAAAYAARDLAGGRVAAVLLDPAARLYSAPFVRVAGPASWLPDGSTPAVGFRDAVKEVRPHSVRGGDVLPALAPTIDPDTLVIRFDAGTDRVLVELQRPTPGTLAP